MSNRTSKFIGVGLIMLACLVAFGPAVGGFLPSLPSIITPAQPGPLHAIIIEDRDTAHVLTQEQLSALQSSAMADYLDSHSAKAANGKPEWRLWDDSFTPEQITESPEWKAVYTETLEESKGVRPYWRLSNGRSTVSGPFPKTEGEAMAVLKKLGGE